MEYHPVAIRLKGKPAVVVGGGPVAERKVAGLLDAGADVTVVSPAVTAGLERLAAKGRISWRKRRVRKLDLRTARVVVTATDDNGVNSTVSKWARQRKVPVNVVDEPRLSDFISPAVLRRSGAIIAVYTDGKDPVLSRDLKNFLKERWDDFLSYRNRP